jgi:hypothetical protein
VKSKSLVTEPSTNRKLDWDQAKLWWRIGLPSQEIARRMKVMPQAVNRYAEQYGWTRDLKARYLEELAYRSTMEFAPPGVSFRGHIPQGSNKVAEKERLAIVTMADEAAAANTNHRHLWQKQRKLLETILNTLEKAMAGEDVDVSIFNGKESPADILVKGTQILARVQTGERLAYGMDEKQKQDPLTVKFGHDEETT